MKFLSPINVNTEYTLPFVDGTNGQVLTTDGNGAVYWGSVSAGSTNLNALTDVELTTPTSGQILRYELPPGGQIPIWRNVTPNYLTPNSSINALVDVTISSPAVGQLLRWNGTYWLNWTPNYLTAESDTLATVTSRGATTTGNITVNGAAFATSFSATGLLITNADTSGSLQPDQGSPANKIYSFRWAGNEQGYIDTNAKITFAGFKTPTGTSAQFLKADGSVDSSTYITSSALSGYATQTWVNANFYEQGIIDDFFSGAEPILGYNKTNWDTAYGWGNHASAGYATTSYVTTAIANLVDAAPSTLDTLNELAAALGDDPNFATTVTNSIATKVPQTRTLTINGTTFDLSANRSWTIDSADGYVSDVRLVESTLSFSGEGSAFTGNIDLSTLPFQPVGSYLTAEADTLDTVTARGATSNRAIRIVGGSDTFQFAMKLAKASYADTGGHTTLIGLGCENAAWSRSAIGHTRTTSYDAGYLGFYVSNNTANGTELLQSDLRMMINRDGNVGIGTTSPVSTDLTGALTIVKSHNSDTATSPASQSYNVNQSNLYLFGRNAGLTAVSASGEESIIAFANPFASYIGGIRHESGTGTAGGAMKFQTGGANERMRITSAGNVGIGTTTPGSKLTVAGSAIAISNGWTGAHDILFVGGSPNSTGAASQTAARIRSTASAPDGAATGDLMFTVNRGDSFVDAIYINPNGNVGIGTTSDAGHLLYVNGTSRFNGVIHGSTRLMVGITSDQTYASILVAGDITTGSSQYALLLDPQLSGTNNYGLLANARIKASHAATNAYGVYIVNNETLSGASIVNNYGLYIADQTRGSSVNYALYSAGGTSYFAGNVGIGTGSPDSKLQVTSTGSNVFRMVRSQNNFGFEATGDSSGGYGLYDYQASSYDIFFKAGNVGIGTTSPGAPLHIYKSDTYSAIISRADWNSGTSTKLALGKQYGVLGFISSDLVETTNDTSYIALNYKNGLTTYAEGLRVYNNGSVGIGTTAPVDQLAIGASSSVAGFSVGSGLTQVFLRYNNYFNVSNQVSDATKGTASIGIGRSSDGVITFWTAAAAAGAPVERMRINNTGNVAIGTTTPANKLDVRGTVRLGGTEAEAYPIKMGWDNNAVYLGGPNNNTINTAYDVNSSYNMHINYVGYLGGTTQFRNLVINNGKQGLIAHFDGATGNVGIGTASPSTALHVSGVITATGGNSTNWNTAYGWGNHATAGYFKLDSVEPITIQAETVTFTGNVTIEGTLTESSSIRFKENIEPLQPSLEAVNTLNPVSYNKIGEDNREIGLIAEEVAELFPEVVTYNEEGQPQGIQYQRLSVILLKAVQELTERVNKLENK